MPSLPFTPTPDVAAILNALLDIYERHEPGRPFVRAIRVRLDELDLPGYTSQIDPAPRQTANEQLTALAERGFVRLAWLPGETGHLLETVTLLPDRAPEIFPWLGRAPWPPRPPRCATCCWENAFGLPRLIGGRWPSTTPWPNCAPANPLPLHPGRSRLQPRSAGRAGGVGHGTLRRRPIASSASARSTTARPLSR